MFGIGYNGRIALDTQSAVEKFLPILRAVS